jgi:hypothetical protein
MNFSFFFFLDFSKFNPFFCQKCITWINHVTGVNTNLCHCLNYVGMTISDFDEGVGKAGKRQRQKVPIKNKIYPKLSAPD